MTGLLLGILFVGLAGVTTVGISIAVRKKRMSLRGGLIQNTALDLIWFGAMVRVLGVGLVPAILMLVFYVTMFDISLLVGTTASLMPGG